MSSIGISSLLILAFLEHVFHCDMLSFMARLQIRLSVHPHLFTVLVILTCLMPLVPLSAASIMPPDIDPPNPSAALLGGWDFPAQTHTPTASATDDDLVIKLQTIGRGDNVYEWFGHSALIVEKPHQPPIMYDYGIFDMDSDNFYWDFAQGRMFYRVISSDARWRQQWVVEGQGREVSMVTLALSPALKNSVVSFLEFNTQPGKDIYLYHQYNDNCSTRIRDILDAATGGEFARWARTQPSTMTLRDHVRRHSASSPAWNLLLDFLQGRDIDKPLTLWEEMFLPEILEDAVLRFPWPQESAGSTLGEGRYMLSTEASLATRPAIAEKPPVVIWQGLGAGICLALIIRFFQYGRVKAPSPSMRRLAGGFERGFSFIILLALTIVSCVLFFMMVASTHDVTWWNENIVFANPLLIIPTLISLRKHPRLHRGKRGPTGIQAMRKYTYVLLGMMVLKCTLPELLFQMNWNIMFFLLPVYAVLGWSYGKKAFDENAANHYRNRY